MIIKKKKINIKDLKKTKKYRNFLKYKKKLQKKKELLLYKRICYKWRLFFVWKKWITKKLISLRFFIWNNTWKVSFKYKYKRKLVLSKKKKNKRFDIKGYNKYPYYTNKDKPFKGLYKYFGLLKFYRYWKAIKKKKHRRFKVWYNFFFYFSRLYKNKLPSVRSYFGFVHTNREYLLNNPQVVSHKPHKESIIERADSRLIIRCKKRSWYPTKKSYWKKLMIKKFFLGYYYINTLDQLRFLIKCSHKKSGSRAYNFYYYLESRVIPTCYRVNFFWNKRRGLNWLNWGFIYLNGRLVKSVNSRVGVNSILRIIVPYNIFRFWTSTKNSAYYSFKFNKINFIENEFSFKYYFSIILNIPKSFRDVSVFFYKKKKHWFNLKTFSYLASSFF